MSGTPADRPVEKNLQIDAMHHIKGTDKSKNRNNFELFAATGEKNAAMFYLAPGATSERTNENNTSIMLSGYKGSEVEKLGEEFSKIKGLNKSQNEEEKKAETAKNVSFTVKAVDSRITRYFTMPEDTEFKKVIAELREHLKVCENDRIEIRLTNDKADQPVNPRSTLKGVGIDRDNLILYAFTKQMVIASSASKQEANMETAGYKHY